MAGWLLPGMAATGQAATTAYVRTFVGGGLTALRRLGRPACAAATAVEAALKARRRGTFRLKSARLHQIFPGVGLLACRTSSSMAISATTTTIIWDIVRNEIAALRKALEKPEASAGKQ